MEKYTFHPVIISMDQREIQQGGSNMIRQYRYMAVIFCLIFLVVFLEGCATSNRSVYENAQARSEAEEELERIVAACDVGLLIKALKDKNPWLRSGAAEALGKIGDARAVEPLITALEDGDSRVQCKAAEALGEIDDARAVKPLINALDNENIFADLSISSDKRSDVQIAAAEALEKIGEPAVEPLINALGKSSSRSFNWRISDVLEKIGEPAVEPLIDALKDGKWMVRLTAADALGKIGDARAVEPLITAMKAERPHQCGGEILALGRIGDARAVEPLVAMLKEKEPSAVHSAAKALGMIGEPAVEPLIDALANGNALAQGYAAEALGEINDARAVEALIAALKDGNTNIIAGAYRFFIRKGIPGTENVLIRVLNSYGDKEMALDFLNCGNSKLEQPARTWARRNDYIITTSSENAKADHPRWGSGR